MEPGTMVQAACGGGVSAAARGFIARAELDAFVERWLPRVHHFAARRTSGRAQTEAVVRAVFEAALREGLHRAGADAAPRMLAHTKAALVRARGGLA